MNNKFDELAKGLAQSVTRRQAFKRFGVGLAGMALAGFGMPSDAEAGFPKPKPLPKGQCELDSNGNYTGFCVYGCGGHPDTAHCAGTSQQPGTLTNCGYLVGQRVCTA